jgi:hypothetical protein
MTPSLTQAKLPKFDLEAFLARQTANLATAQEAQKLLVEAAQAIAEVQNGGVEERAAAKKAASAAEQGVDLGLAAQRKVIDLVSKRAQANVVEFKALAA